MWRCALLLLVAACWTGPDPAEPTPPAPAHRPPVDLVVTMRRTPCFGDCPAYSVEIHGDGHLLVRSGGSVRTRVVPRSRVAQLARKLEAVHFFELDDQGHPPAQAQCVQTGTMTTCTIRSFTICTDTSHAIITVKRGGRTHTIDDAHCGDDRWLAGLEDMIDVVAGTPPPQL